MWGACAGLAPSPELPSQRELWRDPGQAWAGSATGVWGSELMNTSRGASSLRGCVLRTFWGAPPLTPHLHALLTP